MISFQKQYLSRIYLQKQAMGFWKSFGCWIFCIALLAVSLLQIIEECRHSPTFNFLIPDYEKEFFVLLFLFSLTTRAQTGKRVMRPDDIFNLKYVGAPEPSPDGKWIKPENIINKTFRDILKQNFFKTS